MPLPQIKALILDQDNTLSCCSEVFHECKARFSTFAAECIPSVSSAYALERYHAHDVVKLKLRDYRVERASESMGEVLEILARENGVTLASGSVAMAQSIGRMIADHDYPLYDGVLEVLKKYQEAGMKMAVYTKGTDFDFQRRKLARNGVDGIVDIIEPTRQKTAEGFLDLARRLGVDPSRCASVGDSSADDVLLGQQAGMAGIHVSSRVASPSFDAVNSAEVVPDATIPTFSALPTVIPYPSVSRRL